MRAHGKGGASVIPYARKSTDEPDRQILSIKAQIAEVKEFALRAGYLNNKLTKKMVPDLEGFHLSRTSQMR